VPRAPAGDAGDEDGCAGEESSFRSVRSGSEMRSARGAGAGIILNT